MIAMMRPESAQVDTNALDNFRDRHLATSPSVMAQAITLTATAAPGSVFTGWTGVCATTGAACGFGAASGLVVIANFQTTSTPVTTYYHLDSPRVGAGGD